MVICDWKFKCYWKFNKTSVWFEVLPKWIFSIMASKRLLKSKTFDKKCKALKGLENDMNSRSCFWEIWCTQIQNP